MNAIHEAIRAERVAAASLKHWGAQYAANPTDANAALYHLAWIDLRAAVDALVAIPIMGQRDELALAQDKPKGTPNGRTYVTPEEFADNMTAVVAVTVVIAIGATVLSLYVH